MSDRWSALYCDVILTPNDFPPANNGSPVTAGQSPPAPLCTPRGPHREPPWACRAFSSRVRRKGTGIAGWLSLAAFVNSSQLALFYGWTSEATQWPASAGLWVAAAVFLLAAQRALSASPAACLAYSAAAVWGLIAVIIEHQAGSLPGARASAAVAAALIPLLCLHGAWVLRGVQQRARVGAG